MFVTWGHDVAVVIWGRDIPVCDCELLLKLEFCVRALFSF